MNTPKDGLEIEAATTSRPLGDSHDLGRHGLADRIAIQGIFRLLCFFVVYVVMVGLLGELFKWSRLTAALLQFVPYCFVLTGIAYSGRVLVRADKQTLLMVSCLVCVFIALGLDVTKNLAALDGLPILGRDSRVRNDIASMAILVALGSFPAASYFHMQELLIAKRQLDEEVAKLQDAIGHVHQLQGLLPICMYCHRIRTDPKSWQQIETYISEHSDATFTHGLCPECARKHRSDPKT